MLNATLYQLSHPATPAAVAGDGRSIQETGGGGGVVGRGGGDIAGRERERSLTACRAAPHQS